jgi:hypothetical protein
MQNTPAGCGSHLPTILRTFENEPKSRSVNNFLECSDLDPNSRTKIFYQPERRLGKAIADREACSLQAWGPGSLDGDSAARMSAAWRPDED